MKHPLVPNRFRVRERREDTHNVFTLWLEPADGVMPEFRPGQFNMLYSPAVGEVPISISGDCERRDVFTHTVRQAGAITKALARLQVGDELGLRGPFGSAWPLERLDGHDVVVMAGGLGIVPLLPVLHYLGRHADRLGRVGVIYGGRQPEDLLFGAALEQLRGSMRIVVTVDAAGPDWRGQVGVVPNLLPKLNFEPANTMALVCGPEIMMRFAQQALLDKGVPAAQLFLSLERNMKCAVAQCGHCQLGPEFICQEGPVLDAARIANWFGRREF